MSITIYKNLLSGPLLEKLHLFSRNGKQPTRTNFFHYIEDVIGYSNAVFCFDLSNELKQELIEELLEKNVFPSPPKLMIAYIHLFSRGSFIPWHTDDQHKYTGTIYLNKSWDANLGGLFLYKDNEELKGLMPTYNMGAFFTPPLWHTTTLTAINAPFRESLQIFVKEF